MKKLFCFLLFSAIVGCVTDTSKLQNTINKLNMRVSLLEQKISDQEAEIELLKTSPKDQK